ncbi:hypothetical protein [Cetobacterium sp.]|uniref:hypothetical protein n=1 Tax=Cetobacterium sp. TaxID=2071632 RepID=UPI003EE5E1C2
MLCEKNNNLFVPGGIEIKFYTKLLTTLFVLGNLAFAKEAIVPAPLELKSEVAIEETFTTNDATIVEISNEKVFKPELRLIGSIYTTHTNDNDIYNNDTNLIGFEYRPIEDFGISFGYFKNSFDNDSYVLAAGKYLRPFKSFNDFYLSLGVGVVKGYEKENYIYDNETGEVIKKSKFNTNIGGDYIIGANVGVGYDITDYLSFNVSYVGAFISTISLKLY